MNSDPSRDPDRDFVDGNVRKIVGVSVLRRIRKIVDERLEDERQKRRLVRWTLVALGAVLVVAWLYALGV